MPVRCSSSGCKYGGSGKLYRGPKARQKAAKQGRAIKASQARQRGRTKR